MNKKIESLIKFFSELEVSVKDITSIQEKENNQKVVIASYIYNNKIFKTRPLYYKHVSHASNVKNIEGLIHFFKEDTYWLDIDIHEWPKGKGESDLEKFVINDMIYDNDVEFRSFLLKLVNNRQTGYIQLITRDGRSGQYYHNLENNNHWHDIILLIKEYIKSNGQEIDKKYFKHLVFKWDGNKNTDRLRSSLSPNFGNRALIHRLRENIKLYKTKSLFTQEKMKPIIDLLLYKKQIILQGPPGTGKTRLAKLIAKNLLDLNLIEELEENEQFSLIQFHPSYTYEDFVRGIVAKPFKGGVLYESEDKVLGKFALKALENLKTSKLSEPSINKLEWVTPLFDEFINGVREDLEDGKTYFLTPKVEIIAITEDSFKYTGVKRWSSEFSLKFKDIIQAYTDGNEERSDIKNNANLSKSARQDVTYIKAILDNFKIYISSEPIPDFSNSRSNAVLKNYVLIIDEINRANISSVLGELIYALEYRGEEVESMYSVDGSKKLILPPNLYIIGTMNTADRSVGHIDYAIRRRFAFIDVKPEKLSNTDEIWFNTEGYEKVERLFSSSNVSNEFKISDVQLGHSYFIVTKETTMEQDKLDELFKIKMQYEVKPILHEYVKDGVLIGKIGDDEISDYIDNL